MTAKIPNGLHLEAAWYPGFWVAPDLGGCVSGGMSTLVYRGLHESVPDSFAPEV